MSTGFSLAPLQSTDPSLTPSFTAMIAGFVFRILYSNNLTEVGFYLPMILCILLSVRRPIVSSPPEDRSVARR